MQEVKQDIGQLGDALNRDHTPQLKDRGPSSHDNKHVLCWSVLDPDLQLFKRG